MVLTTVCIHHTWGLTICTNSDFIDVCSSFIHWSMLYLYMFCYIYCNVETLKLIQSHCLLVFYLHVFLSHGASCLSLCYVCVSVCVSRRGHGRDCGSYKSPWINHVTMEEEDGWVPPGLAQSAACSAPQCTTTPSTTILSSLTRFMDWYTFVVPWSWLCSELPNKV